MTGIVVWFTGLPSSGKSTLAAEVAGELRLRGIEAVTLDSDEVRGALVPPLGYDDTSRTQLYTTLANLAALLARQGHVVLVPATAHRRAFRDAARERAPSYFEIFVATPLEECRRRDTKGLYAAHAPLGTYEPPLSPDLTVKPDDEDAAATIAARVAASLES